MNENTLKQAQIEVLARIRDAAGRHAEVVAELVELLARAKAIVAAETLGHGSLFDYCRKVLNMSRDQAYRYLACADVVTKHPHILDALKTGRLNATGVATLAPYVKAHTVEAGAQALERAEGKTVEAIELLLAELSPKPNVEFTLRPYSVRDVWPQTSMLRAAAHRLSTARSPLTSHDMTRAKAVPLSPTSYKLTMSMSAETYRELQELRDLVSHIIPSGQLDKVTGHGIKLALKHARKAKWKTEESPTSVASDHNQDRAEAETPTDTSSEAPVRPLVTKRRVNQTWSRYPSAALRREVYLRDGGRCAVIGPDGRCGSTWQIEMDHIIRVADGGETTLENLRLCCRGHNQAREIAA